MSEEYKSRFAPVVFSLAVLCISLSLNLNSVLGQTPVVRDHAMCMDVDASSERPLNRTYEFHTVDRQAVSWLEIDVREIGPAQVSWQWYDPSGRVYRNNTKSVNVNAPGPKRFWDILPVRDFLDNKTGSWAVVVYHRAQTLYRESFSVDSSRYEVAVGIKNLGRNLAAQVMIDGRYVSSLASGVTKVYSVDNLAPHNVSVQSAITVGNGSRYFCRTGWRTVTSRIELSFEYELQFYLLVKSERGEIEPNVNGWHKNGTVVAFKAPSTVPAFPGVQYVFRSWRGGFTGDQPSVLLVMNQPRTIEAVWVPDYTLLFIFVMTIGGACTVVLAMVVLKRREAARIKF